MPRANRHFLPGYVWHITHRCHHKQFLLKFARDRRRYLHWVFEAKKRFGLSVLNYVVTCNHVHLLVKDTGRDVISQSIQLIAGRTAQEYNQRKNRQGAFWEDRYHATAIEADEHLHRCLVYIDLNMVRAGVVNHPLRWKHGGYREIQDPPERYALLDLQELTALRGFAKVGDFQKAHRQWIEHALENGRAPRIFGARCQAFVLTYFFAQRGPRTTTDRGCIRNRAWISKQQKANADSWVGKNRNPGHPSWRARGSGRQSGHFTKAVPIVPVVPVVSNGRKHCQ
jgi:REP-associated tyrosine transposase